MIKHTPETLKTVIEGLEALMVKLDVAANAIDDITRFMPGDYWDAAGMRSYRQEVLDLRDLYRDELERAEKRAVKGGEA